MIQYQDQQLHVSGRIDFENAEQYYQDGLKLIQSQNQYPVVVNLAQLEHGNTLSLAVLVQWLRKVPTPQDIHFKNVPEAMLKIIQSCHLQEDLKLL